MPVCSERFFAWVMRRLTVLELLLGTVMLYFCWWIQADGGVVEGDWQAAKGLTRRLICCNLIAG